MYKHDSPDWRFQFEQPFCCLDSLPNIVDQHADSEELTHIPVIVHFHQAPFSSQQTVQLDTLRIWIVDKVMKNFSSFCPIKYVSL